MGHPPIARPAEAPQPQPPELAGAIPYRLIGPGCAPQVMLITTSAGTWGIPKGRIDGDETAAEAADRESHEEAGVVGCIDFPALGTYVHPRRESRQPVEVFSLRVDRVLTRWPEATRRKRLWVPVEHARRLIPHSDLAALLTRLEAILTADRAPLRKAG